MSMTRESKTNWIKNKLFENGGEIVKRIPVSYRLSVNDNVKHDMSERLTCYEGEDVMVFLVMYQDAVPIGKLTDESVDNVFQAVCF